MKSCTQNINKLNQTNRATNCKPNKLNMKCKEINTYITCYQIPK